jgi:hypothetical protein
LNSVEGFDSVLCSFFITPLVNRACLSVRVSRDSSADISATETATSHESHSPLMGSNRYAIYRYLPCVSLYSLHSYRERNVGSHFCIRVIRMEGCIQGWKWLFRNRHTLENQLKKKPGEWPIHYKWSARDLSRRCLPTSTPIFSPGCTFFLFFVTVAF